MAKHDWKGTKVVISIYRKMGKAPPEWVESRNDRLDTDSMEMLFQAYDPLRHQFIIIPA